MRNVSLALGLASALILVGCNKKESDTTVVTPPAMDTPAAEAAPAMEPAPAPEVVPAPEAAPPEAAPAQ